MNAQYITKKYKKYNEIFVNIFLYSFDAMILGQRHLQLIN